jgi:hypothetical protein
MNKSIGYFFLVLKWVCFHYAKMLVQLFYVSCLNSLEFIKILKFLCVLVVPILFIGNLRQGKSASGDERCKSSNNNNTYNEGEGGSSNNTCNEGEGSSNL